MVPAYKAITSGLIWISPILLLILPFIYEPPIFF
jgi:hypothetical protein